MLKKMTKKYAIHYYDVWGNSDDGYEVNDVYPSIATIDIPVNWNDPTIIAMLQDRNERGECQSTYHFAMNDNWKPSDFRIDGEEDHSMYITYTPTELPICELRIINNDN